MKANENANLILNALNDCGYESYFVGGCVRDYIMGRECNDYDITTCAKPLEIEAALDKASIKYFETGLKHGTITAVINDESFEITTYRTDGDYIDSRHPENVNFVSSICDDLARRDFTINAIAYNKKNGIVDKFNGVDDISKGIIRTVGNPNERFSEDALRIMRALRFSSTLGFDIELETSYAIHKNAHLLNNISEERIYSELIKLLLGDNCESVLLEYKDVIGVIIPELVNTFDCLQNTKWHLYDVYTHTVKSVAACAKIDYIRLALLLHDVGKPACKTTDEKNQDHFFGHPKKSFELSKEILKRLKVSRETSKKVLTLVEIHDKKIYLTNESVKRWIRQLGEDLFFDFMDVKIADMSSHNLDYAGDSIILFEKIKAFAKSIIEQKEPYKISDLAINGNDLKVLGYSGEKIKIELEILISRVCNDKELNEKAILLDIAKKDRKR